MEAEEYSGVLRGVKELKRADLCLLIPEVKFSNSRTGRNLETLSKKRKLTLSEFLSFNLESESEKCNAL